MKQYYFIAMEYQDLYGDWPGRPFNYNDFNDKESAFICANGFRMAKNEGVYGRIYDSEEDNLIDIMAEEEDNSERTEQDLEVIRKYIKENEKNW